MDNDLIRLFIPRKKRRDMSPELAAEIDRSDREIDRELSVKAEEFTNSNEQTQTALAKMLAEIARNHPGPNAV